MEDKEIIFIQRDVERSKATQKKYWFAKCPYCGNIFSARYSDLKRKHTRSCGCLTLKKDGSRKQKHVISEGDVFGFLTVLTETKHDSRGRGYFLCQCKCGQQTEVRRDLLISGNTQSCGCQRFQSRGEQKIKSLLEENNISFEKEKTFESCRFPDTNQLARFDFYIDNKYIIEYDGQQHFSYRKTGWNNKQNFLKTQQHDNFKNKWCKQNNISIIRIPYWKINSLTITDLLL